MSRSLRIAVQGCCHGELNAVYAAIAKDEVENDYKVDLLIVGGDFQSIRNLSDLSCMAVPAKFRRLGDFADYYAGRKVAPVLTLFVGGNHEASNYLQELFYGGWVAPNIYYMGAANIVHFAGLRIGGISGIWSKGDYVRGHMERAPYDKNTLRSVYHVRQFEVKELLQMSRPEDRCDIFLSHDWPRGIEQHGDTRQLLKRKPFFKDEIARNDLGSPANEELLEALKPRYWFSAHLHVRFEATVNHAKAGDKRAWIGHTDQPISHNRVVVDGDQPIEPASNPDRTALDLAEAPINPDEIVLDLDDMDDLYDEDGTMTAKVADTSDTAIEPIRHEIISEAQETTHASRSAPDMHASGQAPTQLGDPAPDLTLEEYKLQVLKRIETNDTPTGRSTTLPAITAEAESHKIDQTYFLALDKCLPRRQYLEILTIDSSGPISTPAGKEHFSLSYDARWLAVLRTYEPYFSKSAYQKKLPDRDILERDLAINEDWIAQNVPDLRVPMNFSQTAPIQDQSITERAKRKTIPRLCGPQAKVVAIVHDNPQTLAFREMLQMKI